MYYIDNYREEAINKLIPYLIEFPEIVTLTENSADRYQAIEDVLWKIATNFRLVDSRGVFLDAHAHNEVVNLIYTDKAKDAFTYGATWTQEQFDHEDYNPRVFGTGKFYSQASYLSGVSKDISEEKLIRAVQEKIIQNNTTGVIEDFIEAMKLHFNATKVEVLESYPLSVTLILSGENLELSSSGDKDAIKKCLPACVSLKDFYINDHKYDRFIYSDKSKYGYDSRYPILLGDTDYMYQYISNAINLNSTDEEYLFIYKTPFSNTNFQQNIPFECIIGKLTDINNNATIYSFVYNINGNFYKISLKIREIDNKYHFVIVKSSTSLSDWTERSVTDTGIIAEVNKDYTFLISITRNINDFFKLWILNGIKLIGQNSNQDASWAYNIIQNNNDYTQIQLNTNNAISYYDYFHINGDRKYGAGTVGTAVDFADFTYYAIVGGEINAENNIVLNDKAHYYVTCFGEKHILFNCLQNKNHLRINTNSSLETNLLVQQGSFNYKKWHSNGRYFNVYNPDIENAGIKWNNNSNIKLNEDGWSTPIRIGTNNFIWNSITYGNGKFIAVGSNGYITTSTDGTTWSTPVQVGSSYWNSIAYGDGKFVAIGISGNAIISIDNGETWTTVTIGSNSLDFKDIIYANGKFVAVGGDGYITTSTDGEIWTTPFQVGTNNFIWNSITYGNGKFVIVGTDGYISTSTDGINWSSRIKINENGYRGITFANGKFVAVGGDGYITTSTDGETWTTPIQISTNTWYNVINFNNSFITIGTNGLMSTSTDGEIWTTPFQVGTNTWMGITYGDGKFVAVGGRFSSQITDYITTYTPPPIDALINSFELSMDICQPLNNGGNIFSGLIGQVNKLTIGPDIIQIPVYTASNVETLYEINLSSYQMTDLITNKFGTLKLSYKDNILLVYMNNTLIKTESLQNVNIRYLTTKLELGPTNAFIKNFKFKCTYTENLDTYNIEYSIPLTKDIYEENGLIQPENISARFLTVPQLIDNKENKDLYGNPVIRKVN